MTQTRISRRARRPARGDGEPEPDTLPVGAVSDTRPAAELVARIDAALDAA